MARKILVVDDELHLVHILTFRLKKAGYETLTAHNGRDGLQLADQHKPDLIVTDFQMPVMSGFDMAVSLQNTAETSEIPLIMLTARGHKIPPSDLAKTNIKSLMAKPFSARELIDNITELLGPDSQKSLDRLSGQSDGEHAA